MTFRVKSYEPKTVRPIDEVREEIIDLVKAQKATKEVNAVARAVQAHWQAGKLDLPPEASGFDVQAFTDISRNGNESLGRDTLAVAFAASAPSEGRSSTFVAPTSDSVVVARVDQINFEVQPDSETNLSSALSQLRTSQEAGEFWSVVTAAAEMVKR
jgi:peptidyl-prolyl cis-trans isomerase D